MADAMTTSNAAMPQGYALLIFSIGDFFRSRLKFAWAQIFNIWDSKDDKLMSFDIIW